MEKEHSKFGAMLNMRCPRCRQGSMFTHRAFSTKFSEMHKNCPVCGQDFEIETGFYWGSMYISYALTVVIFIVVFVGTNLILNSPEPWVYLVILGSLLLVLSPVIFRFSRVLMLHWFGGVKYDKSLKFKV